MTTLRGELECNLWRSIRVAIPLQVRADSCSELAEVTLKHSVGERLSTPIRNDIRNQPVPFWADGENVESTLYYRRPVS